MKTLWIASALAVGLMATPAALKAQPGYSGYYSGARPHNYTYNQQYSRYYGSGYYGNRSYYGGPNYGSKTYPHSWGRTSSRDNRSNHHDNDKRWDGNPRWDRNNDRNDDRWERHQRATPSDGRWKL